MTFCSICHFDPDLSGEKSFAIEQLKTSLSACLPAGRFEVTNRGLLHEVLYYIEESLFLHIK